MNWDNPPQMAQSLRTGIRLTERWTVRWVGWNRCLWGFVNMTYPEGSVKRWWFGGFLAIYRRPRADSA